MAIISWRAALLAALFLNSLEALLSFCSEKGRGCLGERICPDWPVTLQNGYTVTELRALTLNLSLEKQNEDARKV